MTYSAAERATVATDSQALAEGMTKVELWLRKIKQAQDDEKDWRTDAEDAIKVFEAEDVKNIAFNLLNSNIETMVPAVYNSSPVPDVRRRYGDKDPIGKQVVDLSERAISFTIDQYDFDDGMEAALQDALVAGRGAIRLRYKADISQDKKGKEDTTTEHVMWDKWVRGPARSWSGVPFIAFEHDLTEDEVKKLNPQASEEIKFGNDKNADGKEGKDAEKGVYRTVKVYEVWDKTNSVVFFISECYKEAFLVPETPDPLGLPDFFPIFVIQRIKRVSGLVPVCPYKVVKSLLEELDVITKRISKLVKQLRVRGLVAGELSDDLESLKSLDDGQFLPAKSAAQFAAGSGGLDKAVWTWPMEPTVAALQQLYVQREQIKQTIYEVTGISDILRGASDPNETLGAQQLKTQWGSIRIQRIQKQVANVARNVFRAMVTIFAGKYSDENLSAMTGLPAQGDQEQMQMWPQVLQLFRSDMRSFRIDIETDSTIRADMTRNQEQMNSFLSGTAQYMQAVAGAMPVFGQAAVPVMVEVFTSFARKYKLGKQAEDALDSLSQIAQQSSQQPPKPNPEEAKAKMEMETMQAKAQMDQQTAQTKLQMEGQKMQLQASHEERMMQIAEQKAAMELQIKQLELQMKQQEIGLNLEAKQQEMALKSQAMHEQHAMDREARAADMDMQHEANELKREGMADKAKFDRQRMANQAKAKPQNGVRA